MNKPIADYRKTLDAKPLFSSVRHERLRTKKKPGHLELVWDAKKREHVLFRHGEAEA